jgi:hypothetical protein
VDLYFHDDYEPRRITTDAGAFDQLATGQPVSELLNAARPARRGVRTRANGTSRHDRVGYATLEHAGQPHRGKTTEAERRLVCSHFDQINEQLATHGLRTLSLDNPDHVERYGLAQLAAERATRDG